MDDKPFYDLEFDVDTYRNVIALCKGKTETEKAIIRRHALHAAFLDRKELLTRYLKNIPEGCRVAAYAKGNKDVLAIARTEYSRVKYYDKYSFDLYGELIPVEPDKEIKWEDMKDAEYARKRWQDTLEKLGR